MGLQHCPFLVAPPSFLPRTPNLKCLLRGHESNLSLCLFGGSTQEMAATLADKVRQGRRKRPSGVVTGILNLFLYTFLMLSSIFSSFFVFGVFSGCIFFAFCLFWFSRAFLPLFWVSRAFVISCRGAETRAPWRTLLCPVVSLANHPKKGTIKKRRAPTTWVCVARAVLVLAGIRTAFAWSMDV